MLQSLQTDVVQKDGCFANFALKIKNMNRYLQIFLLFILINLISCSTKNDNRIVIWHSLRPAEREILRNQLDQFGINYPNWVFEELFYAPEQARTNYIISAMGGSGPALFWGASDNIGPLVELEVIRPMDDLFEQHFLDSFITYPISANTWFRNHLYQIADRVGNHLCLVYNKDLVPEPPETFSELIELGEKLSYDSDNDGKNDHYVLAWNYTEPFFAVPFIGGFGGWIMDLKNQPTLNIKPIVKAAQFIADLSKTYKIIPLECDYETANAMFIDGYAAMIINGPWSWGTYTENKINFGVSRIPKIDETSLWPTPLVSPLGYSINVNLEGEQLEMTVALLKYLTSPQNELEYTKISATIPSRKEANKNPLVTENDLLQKSIDQMQVGKLMPVVSELRWIWDAMRPSYQAIFTGSKTAEQAAEDMQKLAVKLIKENRE